MTRQPIQVSGEAPNSIEPVFEEEFVFLVSSPASDNLTIQIRDGKTKCPLGFLQHNLCSLLNNHTAASKCQPFKLDQSSPNSYIIMSIQLLFPKKN